MLFGNASIDLFKLMDRSGDNLLTLEEIRLYLATHKAPQHPRAWIRDAARRLAGKPHDPSVDYPGRNPAFAGLPLPDIDFQRPKPDSGPHTPIEGKTNAELVAELEKRLQQAKEDTDGKKHLDRFADALEEFAYILFDRLSYIDPTPISDSIAARIAFGRGDTIAGVIHVTTAAGTIAIPFVGKYITKGGKVVLGEVKFGLREGEKTALGLTEKELAKDLQDAAAKKLAQEEAAKRLSAAEKTRGIVRNSGNKPNVHGPADFAEEAKRITDAHRAERNPAVDAKAMALSRKQALKRLEGEEEAIRYHLDKHIPELIGKRPQTVDYWRREVSKHIDKLEELAEKVGGKTADEWRQKVAEYRRRLKELLGGD